MQGRSNGGNEQCPGIYTERLQDNLENNYKHDKPHVWITDG